MRIDIHHHFHGDAEHKIDKLISLITTNNQNQIKMGAELDNLKKEVTENTTVIQSAVTLLSTLSSKIEELKNDPVALQKLADDLNTNEQALAQAVAANTPAEGGGTGTPDGGRGQPNL